MSVAVALKSPYLSVHSFSPTCDKAMVPVTVARPAQDVLVPALHTCIVSRHVHTLCDEIACDGNYRQWDSVGLTSC